MTDFPEVKHGPRMMRNASKTNDKLTALIALREYLARSLDECDSARDRAALANRFMDCVNAIEEMGVTAEETETAAERAAREAKELME